MFSVSYLVTINNTCSFQFKGLKLATLAGCCTTIANSLDYSMKLVKLEAMSNSRDLGPCQPAFKEIDQDSTELSLCLFRVDKTCFIFFTLKPFSLSRLQDSWLQLTVRLQGKTDSNSGTQVLVSQFFEDRPCFDRVIPYWDLSLCLPRVDKLCSIFQILSLQPVTITGYHTAIADSLGFCVKLCLTVEAQTLVNQFSHTSNRIDRTNPPWGLSLVLHSDLQVITSDRSRLACSPSPDPSGQNSVGFRGSRFCQASHLFGSRYGPPLGLVGRHVLLPVPVLSLS